MTTTAAVSAAHPLAPELPAVEASLTRRTLRAEARADTFAGKAPSSTASRATASKASSAKSSSARTTSAKSTTTVPKELSFIHDPKLSVQEKVFRLLLYIQAKYDKQVEAKMQELSGAKKTSSTRAAKKPKSKPKGWKKWVGKFVDGTKKICPDIGVTMKLLQNPATRGFLKKVTGPVLAAACTAFGMPELAPLALKYGATIVDGAAKVSKYADDLSPGAKKDEKSSTAASASKADEGDGASLADEKRISLELEYLLDRQKFATGLLSNCMRSMHETQMSVVTNIR